MSLHHEAARCPYPSCAASFLASPSQREVHCPACSRFIRVRLVRHEVAMHRRQQAVGTHRSPSFGALRACLLVEDVRSQWNIGSLLRTADGLGVDHVFLCGASPVPPSSGIRETALGAEEAVSWSYHPHAFEVLEAGTAKGLRFYALERAEGASTLEDLEEVGPACLVVGSEVAGISPEVLDRCARVLGIPMRGVKSSLNVAVAGGIGLYMLQRALSLTRPSAVDG